MITLFTQVPRWFKAIFIIIIVLLVVSAGANAWLWNKVANLQNPQAAAQAEVRRTLAEIGQLILLPQGETPTIAAISDLASLKNQPFFANARVGDLVIVYATARKAILWRPSENKIIEVAPLSASGPSAAAQSSATSVSPK